MIVLTCVLLCSCFYQAETRAEFAERTVAKLEKSIDDLEGMSSEPLTHHNVWTTSQYAGKSNSMSDWL